MNKNKLILFIVFPVLIGIIIGFITSSFNNYEALTLPPYSPPKILFPIIWSVLYILMGVSSYIINEIANIKYLNIYFLQLFFNALWPIFFFVFRWYLFSFLWLIILLILIATMIIKFKKINVCAAYLQIPYLIWCVFASYLNLMIFLLN